MKTALLIAVRRLASAGTRAPHPGRFSSEARFQEHITDPLYRGAIAAPPGAEQ